MQELDGEVGDRRASFNEEVASCGELSLGSSHEDHVHLGERRRPHIVFHAIMVIVSNVYP